MFCVNCFSKDTRVVNSRPHKKYAAVWRRRKCPECTTIFTTIERPSLAENTPVYLESGKSKAFNLGKLIISIARAFSHDPKAGEYQSLWLAQTVENTLSSQHKVITPDDIAAITHQVLQRFDELAAVQYAARHQLIVSTKRRPGRPSLRGREPRIDESPSR